MTVISGTPISLPILSFSTDMFPCIASASMACPKASWMNRPTREGSMTMSSCPLGGFSAPRRATARFPTNAPISARSTSSTVSQPQVEPTLSPAFWIRDPSRAVALPLIEM